MRSPNSLLSREWKGSGETSAWSCGLSRGDSSSWWEDGTNWGVWSEERAQLECGVG